VLAIGFPARYAFVEVELAAESSSCVELSANAGVGVEHTSPLVHDCNVTPAQLETREALVDGRRSEHFVRYVMNLRTS